MAADLIAPDAVWLIYFDDYDRRPEIVVGEVAARHRFAQISDNWNAHLFVKVESNSRDDKYAKANLPAGVMVDSVPERVLIFQAFDAAAQSIPNDDTRNNVREFLMRAWHHNVLPVLNAAGVDVACYPTICKDADGTRRVKDE